MSENKQINLKEINKQLDTEVLICGGGTAGIIAAISAAENGAQVILLEKNSSCYPPRNFIGAVGSKIQKEQGIEIDRNEIVNYLCNHASYRVDQRLINLWADESGEMMDWLCGLMTQNGMKVYLETDINKDTYLKEWQTSHTFYKPEVRTNPGGNKEALRILRDKMDSLNVTVMLETPMVDLIYEEGKVKGVAAKDKNGEYIKINAAKGVILATGGYSSNMEMLKKFNPAAAKSIAGFGPSAKVMGDGINSALKIGAVKDEVATAMIFDRAAIKPGLCPGKASEGRPFWLGSQPFLKVNKSGERYCNESIPYDFGVHAASMQEGKVWCSIFDSNWREDVLAFHTIGCSRISVNPRKYPINVPMIGAEKMVEMLLKEGYIVQGNTIEELAEKLFIPEKNLKVTVERYNELCEKGYDDDFGKVSYRMRPVNKPPFFGITVAGSMMCTLDGLRINTNMQVLNNEMKPIEGLFAVGNDSGSFFANSYPELCVGLAAGRAMTFARHVGIYLSSLK